MSTLELVALRQKMAWVMLTVFKANKPSMGFFMEKMQYDIDETSPSQCDDALLAEDKSSYEILSKSLQR